MSEGLARVRLPPSSEPRAIGHASASVTSRERQRGIAMGIATYASWGIMPLFWRLVRSATATEILAHRVTWSLLFVGALLPRAGGLRSLRRLDRRRLALLALASVLIGFNWGVYVWAVNSGHVVETALGYFINPPITVLLGVVVLRESLRRVQWIAVAIVLVAVVVLAYDYGRPPWIALMLAGSFATYGLVKKRVGVSAIEGLFVESAFLFVPAVAYLVFVEAQGTATFGHVSPWTSALLLSTGVVTAVPLLGFAGAANRIPLSMIGPLQYISPSLQFLCGVLVFHEAMPASRWVGFGLVWAALLVFLVEGVLAARSQAAALEARTK